MLRVGIGDTPPNSGQATPWVFSIVSSSDHYCPRINSSGDSLNGQGTSLGLAAAAGNVPEILCKLVSCHQHSSSHPYRDTPTTPASGFLRCVLVTPNVEFAYLLPQERRSEGCMPHSELKELGLDMAISFWAELELGLHYNSSSRTREHHPYYRQLCNTSRVQLSTSNSGTSERRRDLLAPSTWGLRAWCDLVLPGDLVEGGFFPV